MAPFLDVLAKLTLVGTAAATALPRGYPSSSQKVLYVMSNMDNANSILSMPVSAAGTLAEGKVTMTGGKGGRAPASSLTDALNSQGAVQIMGDKLLAVNAGSNTLSMFRISEEDPLSPKLLGQPMSTQGDFPNSIAVSEKLGIACVSNTGTNSGVACFKMSDSGLTHMDQTLRELPLTPKQTNPPNGPFNTVSQIFFNSDSSALYATVKGDPTANNTGYFGVFPVENGSVSSKLTQSSPSGTAVLFGSVALPGDKVFVTDASFGAAVLGVSAAGSASTLGSYKIPTNKATCWAAISPATGLGYVSDDGANTIVSFDPESAQFKATTTLPNGNGANTELVADGSMLYALSHGNATHPPAVVVMQTEKTGGVKQIQNFVLKNANDNVEGMAVYSGCE